MQTVSNGPLTSHGKQVYFDTEGLNLIGYYNANGDNSDYDAATDTKVFTMTLAPTGAYTFTLHAPVDQPIGGEDSIAINLNGRVTVTDSGGPGPDTQRAAQRFDHGDRRHAGCGGCQHDGGGDQCWMRARLPRYGLCPGDGQLSLELRRCGFRRRRGRQRVLYAGSDRRQGHAEPIGLRPERGWL